MKRLQEALVFSGQIFCLCALIAKDLAVVQVSVAADRAVAWAEKNPADAFNAVAASGTFMLIGLSLGMVFRG